PDFFNVKQFPTISFKSTAVKAGKDGYEVTGDLTMHGVTKPVTFALVGGRSAQFPKGVQRTGFSTEFVLKRADFGIDKFGEALGEDVPVAVSFEGTKKYPRPARAPGDGGTARARPRVDARVVGRRLCPGGGPPSVDRVAVAPASPSVGRRRGYAR